MFDPLEPSLFDAWVFLILAFVGASVSVALAFVALSNWLRRRRAARLRAEAKEAHTGAIKIAGQIAGRSVKVTKVKAGRTKKAKAIATAFDVLKEVDDER